MKNVTEKNWRIQFWNQWEEWEDTHHHEFLEIFKSPVHYMQWAEIDNSDLYYSTPWEFVAEHGPNSLMDYLLFLARKDYWEKVSRDWVEKFSA